MNYKISILVDDPNSWISPYINDLNQSLLKLGHQVNYVHNALDIKQGDILFILGCTKILKNEFLNLNKKNFVVHESDLPRGKGWSPVAWQIEKGLNNIPITLFEATEKTDAGDIYLQRNLIFKGHELLNEIHEIQGQATIAICLELIKKIKSVQPIAQTGDSTFYAKRTNNHNTINPHLSIAEQFNKFRVADNKKFPIRFELNGIEYQLKISKS